MMRGAALEDFAAAQGFPLLTIAQLVAYRQIHG